MPKAAKPGFYAVHAGRKPGIYATWEECESQIKGYPKALHKKFRTQAEAEAYVKFGDAASTAAAAAPVPTISSAKSENITLTKHSPKKSYMKRKTGTEPAKIVDETGWDVVYTDGACQGNGKQAAVAGIGVWWGNGDQRNLSERCPGDQTNNRAEIIAIIRVLETAPSGIKRLLIKTDSVYSIKCIREWLPNWRRRGWKTSDGKEVKNKAVIMYLAHLLDEYGRKGRVVQLQHVRGHAGEIGNESADQLAGLGAARPSLPERNWETPMEEDPKEMGKDANVEYLIEAGDLLDSEKMAEMARSGEFD